MSFVQPVFAPFLFLTFCLFAASYRSRKIQIALLLGASYLFYGWVSRLFVTLVLFSTILDYSVGWWLAQTRSPVRRKWLLALSLTGNLGLLAYFKYLNFFIENVNALGHSLGIPLSFTTLNIVLPIGISFYTFQTLSYSLDIYLGKLKPTKSFLEFSYFVAAFPQLLAGPIVRAREFLPQLRNNLVTESRYEGWFYIVFGIAKKLLIADLLGTLIVDPVFAEPTNYSVLERLLAVNAFGFQLYFDFSGYSHIAIGLGRLFGVQLPENFRSPLFVKDPDSFWKRWHISLTSWFRDYVFMPLASRAARRSVSAIYAAMILTFLINGFWHGASWNFIIFGLIHGLYLVLFQAMRTRSRLSLALWSPIAYLLFYQLLCLPWVFLRATSFEKAVQFLNPSDPWIGEFAFPLLTIGALFVLGSFVHSYIEPRLQKLIEKIQSWHWVIHALLFFCAFGFMAFVTKNFTRVDLFFYFKF